MGNSLDIYRKKLHPMRSQHRPINLPPYSLDPFTLSAKPNSPLSAAWLSYANTYFKMYTMESTSYFCAIPATISQSLAIVPLSEVGHINPRKITNYEFDMHRWSSADRQSSVPPRSCQSSPIEEFNDTGIRQVRWVFHFSIFLNTHYSYVVL